MANETLVDAPGEVLVGRAVPQAVLDLVNAAKEYIVLVCPFVENWRDLSDALRAAKDRGVEVSLLTESPRSKRKDAVRAFIDESGVSARQVDSVHAKVYLNEITALVSSFNLLDARREPTDVGVLLKSDTAHDALLDWVESLEGGSSELRFDRGDRGDRGDRRGRRGGRSRDRDRDDGGNDRGADMYCIGCGEQSGRISASKPLCDSCFDLSDRGDDLDALPEAKCVGCGGDYDSTPERPFCSDCFRSRKR